jgi:hypothetical protein
LAKIQVKNAGYNRGDNPFQSYQATELMGNCSTEQGIVARITEKTNRTITQLNKEDPIEQIEETIMDTIGCLAILLAYLDSKNG